MNKTTLLFFFISFSLYAQTSDWSWVKSFENLSASTITNSFMDNQKNIYHIGSFSSPSITIGETVISNSSEIPQNPNMKYSDAYISKYDSQGNLLFVKHFIGSKYENLTSIAYDNNSNFYITGYYSGNITIGNTSYETPSDMAKCFLAKLDLNGNVIWSKPLNFNGSSILKFKDNNLYIAGIHSGDTFTIDNLTTPSVGYTAVVNGMDKTFVAKLDLSGNPIWLKSSTYNGSATISDYHRLGTQVKGLAIDNLGNVYVAGVIFSRSSTFGTITITKTVTNNNSNLFITKYDSSGNVAWANTAPTNSAANSVVSDIATDSNNNIYLLGQIYNSATNFGGTSLNFPGNYGSFLVKYATNGSVVWAKSGKIASDAQPNTGIGYNFFDRMFIDSNNNVHVTGLFSNYINFGNNVVMQTSNWAGNLFSIKYDSSGNASDFYKITETINSRNSQILDISGDVFYYTGYVGDATFVLGDVTINNPTFNSYSYIAKRDKRLSIEEHSGKDFIIYPNPSQELIYVSGLNSSENNVLTVFDMTGKRIKSLEFTNNDTIAIDVKDLASGSYVLKIESGTLQKSIKFIKS
ncbi:T9SS type A sorting domain-containing protein [Flavobacterium microcysteis]|uniref:T9SS type A sorting domain-containing protein n=1 Tax=Flavobacterium microcysteis TaxID=2596891 RepID=A0A501QL90_9FLAO|nr:T9SS type A sorting domain-containing protein [Flavobacterium microcysteis]TPD73423.1 T9SS type A sorting domain-containing protein [Flavobacterium microcysteis]